MKTKNEKIQLAMVISIYFSILILIIAIIVIVKNVNEIKTDPIVYGINKNNYFVCTCYDENGSHDYNSTGYIPKKIYGYNIKLD